MHQQISIFLGIGPFDLDDQICWPGVFIVFVLCPFQCQCQYQWLVSLVAQLAKNLPAVQETPVRLLGLADPLEKEMATHTSILAWRIPWIEESGGLQSMGLQELDMT